MMKPDLISVNATDVHRAAREAMLATMQAHADKMTPPEMLALLAHMVGQMLALQDQRTMTPQMAIALVQQNIESGNRAAIEQWLGPVGGNA